MFRSTHDLTMPGHLDDKLVDSGRYDALRNTHNHDQDDNHSESSSTEVDEEWGDNEEEAGSDSRLNCPSKKSREWRRRRGSVWAKIQKYRWVVDTALLLVIVGLLLEKRWSHRRAHRYEFAGDVTGFAPKFSQQIKTFKPDPIFVPENASEFWSSETQQAWLDIVPKALGYVRINNTKDHDNLPSPIHDYADQAVFTTSMTHQLHCLHTIIDAYTTLNVTRDPSRIEYPWHVTHCFEYIRQAIMCTGDVALEGAATTFPLGEDGEDLGGSDGWDAKHVCKDYGEVLEYLNREAVDQNKWI